MTPAELAQIIADYLEARDDIATAALIEEGPGGVLASGISVTTQGGTELLIVVTGTPAATS